MIKYFVSYFWANKGANGWGSCTFKRDRAIQCMEDLVAIQEEMQSQLQMQKVVITNWRRFEEAA